MKTSPFLTSPLSRNPPALLALIGAGLLAVLVLLSPATARAQANLVNYGAGATIWNVGGYPRGVEKLLKIVGTGRSNGAPTFNGELSIGAVTWRVMDGQSAGIGNHNPNDWYLVNTRRPSPAGQAALSTAPGVGSTLLWFGSDDTLLKRMGELRTTANASHPDANRAGNDWEAWVRTHGAQYHISRNINGSPFSQYTYGVDLGADKRWQLDARNTVFTGLFVGYGRADLDYENHFNGDGKLETFSGGFYKTWLHDTGLYADFVGKAAYGNSRFNAWDRNRVYTHGSYHNWALGLSLELGKQIALKNGWYVEPQLQASYAHILGGDYTTTGNNKFQVQNTDADIVQLRYGAVLGRNIQLRSNTKEVTVNNADNTSNSSTSSNASNTAAARLNLRQIEASYLQPYVKLFGQNQLSSGGEVQASGMAWRPNLDGAAAVLGTGLTWQINNKNQLNLDYETVIAQKYEKTWDINLSFRHTF